MKSFFLFFSMVLLLWGCGVIDKNNSDKKFIQIGMYKFSFPKQFKLIEERGVDSNVGRVTNDTINLYFDTWYYLVASVKSSEEYLKEGLWKTNIADRFMKPGITYDINNYPKVDILNIRPANSEGKLKFNNADFIANCKHDSINFEYPIYLPEKTKKHNIYVDTFQNHWRKLVTAVDPLTGTTGIYLQNLIGINGTNDFKIGLSLYTSKLTIQQQQEVLKIFSSVQFRTEK